MSNVEAEKPSDVWSADSPVSPCTGKQTGAVARVVREDCAAGYFSTWTVTLLLTVRSPALVNATARTAYLPDGTSFVSQYRPNRPPIVSLAGPMVT